MSVIDTLIYDRTAADVERVYTLAKLWVPGNDGKPIFIGTPSEKAEWDAGLKGAYNASDLNRVGAALQYLAQWFETHGYSVDVSVKTDWVGGELPDVPTMVQLQSYLAQVEKIRSVVPVFLNTPQVPDDLPAFTWQDANAVEKILADVEQLVQNMEQTWIYSGEVECGEVPAYG